MEFVVDKVWTCFLKKLTKEYKGPVQSNALIISCMTFEERKGMVENVNLTIRKHNFGHKILKQLMKTG